MWIKWIIFLIGVLFCRNCANMDNLVRYWKELSQTIQIAGIGSKACRRRNRVPSRSFSTLNRAETRCPVKSDRLLIKNGPRIVKAIAHFLSPNGLSSSKCAKTWSAELCLRPRWGSLRHSPRHLVGWGGDTPPHSPLLNTISASNSAPRSGLSFSFWKVGMNEDFHLSQKDTHLENENQEGNH